MMAQSFYTESYNALFVPICLFICTWLFCYVAGGGDLGLYLRGLSQQDKSERTGIRKLHPLVYGSRDCLCFPLVYHHPEGREYLFDFHDHDGLQLPVVWRVLPETKGSSLESIGEQESVLEETIKKSFTKPIL